MQFFRHCQIPLCQYGRLYFPRGKKSIWKTALAELLQLLLVRALGCAVVMPGEMITEEIVMFLKNYRFLTIKVVK